MRAAALRTGHEAAPAPAAAPCRAGGHVLHAPWGAAQRDGAVAAATRPHLENTMPGGRGRPRKATERVRASTRQVEGGRSRGGGQGPGAEAGKTCCRGGGPSGVTARSGGRRWGCRAAGNTGPTPAARLKRRRSWCANRVSGEGNRARRADGGCGGDTGQCEDLSRWNTENWLPDQHCQAGISSRPARRGTPL